MSCAPFLISLFGRSNRQTMASVELSSHSTMSTSSPLMKSRSVMEPPKGFEDPRSLGDHDVECVEQKMAERVVGGAGGRAAPRRVVLGEGADLGAHALAERRLLKC